MPRRGSRAQLLRDIAASRAALLSSYEDGWEVSPEDARKLYEHYSTEQLRELARREEVEPEPRGRPSSFGRHLTNMELVRAVEKVMRFHRLSVTAACNALAVGKRLRLPSGGKARRALEKLPNLLMVYHPISGPALRQRYYRAKRRMR
jgi:hypothetical protein